MPLNVNDVRTLVTWLGEDGAAAGLERGNVTVSELREILAQLGRDLPKKARRKDIISEILFSATRRIDKPLDELLEMNPEDILVYLDERRPSRTEVLRLLAELDFVPNSEAQRDLYRYAARQIGETGLFQRVAKGPAR